MIDPPPASGKVFISYAHADNESPHKSERWLDRLLEHLHSVQLGTNSSVFSDADVGYGEDWHEKIQASLAEAKVAVLLVSSAFLKSKYIREHELPRLLEMRSRHALLIIPLIVRPCAFKEATYRYPSPHAGPEELLLSKLHTPTPPSNPLSSLQAYEQDQILAKLASHIKQVLECRAPNAAASSSNIVAHRQPVQAKRKSGLWVAAVLVLILISVPLAIWSSNSTRTSAPPPPPPTPSVLFGNIPASDLQRLEGATENDVIRLALECENEQVRHLAQVFENRPAAMLSLVQVIVESRSRPLAATLNLSDSDMDRLAGATENDVVRLASECSNETIRNLAVAFESQPSLLLEFVKELIKWHESRSP